MMTELKLLVKRRQELKQIDLEEAASCSVSGNPYTGKYKKKRKKIEKQIFNLIEQL